LGAGIPGEEFPVIPRGGLGAGIPGEELPVVPRAGMGASGGGVAIGWLPLCVGAGKPGFDSLPVGNITGGVPGRLVVRRFCGRTGGRAAKPGGGPAVGMRIPGLLFVAQEETGNEGSVGSVDCSGSEGCVCARSTAASAGGVVTSGAGDAFAAVAAATTGGETARAIAGVSAMVGG
jgi:hypothetical protein